MGLILGLIGMCLAADAIETLSETSTKKAEIQADATRYAARVQADATKFAAREQTQREIVTSQIQWDAMRDIECMRAQTQVITANARSGYYESLFTHQAPQQYIQDTSSIVTPTATVSKRFCSYCGERLNDGVRFCSNCGKQV